MALGWQFYARRPFGGPWLSTDVQLDGRVTADLSGPGMVVGSIPAGLDVHMAEDGRPLWLERGTLLYAEQHQQLVGVYVCTFTGATETGRDIEAVGLSGALQWMPFDSELSAWHPHPFDVVDTMLEHAQSYPNGNLGFVTRRLGDPVRGVGDVRPPGRPVKPGRRAGESKEHYDDRLLRWEMAVDEWEALHKDAEKYLLAWWEAPMIGEELDQLAGEVPFDYRERHRWTNRDRLEAEHVLELGAHLGVRRLDIKLVDGVNLAERPQPETDTDDYANDVIMLGAGEGRDMRRGRNSVDDGRIRSTRFVAAKGIRNRTRLATMAAAERKRSAIVTNLDSVRVWDMGGYAPVSSLIPGDEVYVESEHTTPAYGAWKRIVSITRSTSGIDTELRFAQEEVGT